MKTLIKAEEAAQLILALYLSVSLPYSWWMYWAWFLSPDLSFIGYAVNTQIGTFTYNLLHHKATAISVYVAGLFLHSDELQFAGLVLFGHSAFDRILGYGLKYRDDVKHTHLGWIGKSGTQ